MDDTEVIEAFLELGTATAFGPTLHVERGTMKLSGWWSVAFRISDRTVLVRDEQPPDASTVIEDLAAALSARGLSAVGRDLPAMAMLIYTNLDLGYGPWNVWSTDLATGESDLNAKATEESFYDGGPALGGDGGGTDYNIAENARGARRLAGDASRVVLTVGVDEERLASLAAHLGADCRFEHRRFGEIDPAGCGALLPTLVVVDATGPDGAPFVAALQDEPGVRAPVVAITADGNMQAGADATVGAEEPPGEWAPLLRDLLR